MKATLFVIENDVDHAQAKALIEKLMGSNDPADRARLTAQARLVEAYEHARWPRRAPSLPDLLTYLMDQHGLSRADLVPLLGTPSRVSEVLTGKRELITTFGSCRATLNSRGRRLPRRCGQLSSAVGR